jgi:hypothetical protein
MKRRNDKTNVPMMNTSLNMPVKSPFFFKIERIKKTGAYSSPVEPHMERKPTITWE